MRTSYKKAFAQFVKKSRRPLQLAIEDEVIRVCNNPKIGQQKTGDLQGVFVHKFHFNKQEYLMAYEFDQRLDQPSITWIKFYQIGSHENFYTQLKRSIRLN